MHESQEQLFLRTYDAVAHEVLGFWSSEMQDFIARHNVGWARPHYDFSEYIRVSRERYVRAYRRILRHRPHATTVCDVGGFWGAFPVTLSRLGFETTMTETFALYSDAFEPLFGYLRKEGVNVVDLDPFSQVVAKFDFDVVAVMAVVEHYPHSLRRFMDAVRRLACDDGLVLLEVPNIAYLPWRLNLLRGRSPLPDILTVYESAEPFTGHHHEFTRDELVRLIGRAGLDLLDVEAFGYSLEFLPPRALVAHPRAGALQLLMRLAFRLYPDTREVFLAVAEPSATARGS